MSDIEFESRDGVGLITLARPDTLNVFSPAMMRELGELYRHCDADESVRVVGHDRHDVRTGVDETTADLDRLVRRDPPGDAEDYPALAEAIRPLLDERTLVVVSTDFTHYGARFGYEPFPTTRDQFKQFMDAESARFADVIKKAGASLD